MESLHEMILDGLMDDVESVGTLRDHGEVEPDALALTDEQDIVDALRELVADGQVDVWEIAVPELRLVPVAEPATDDASLRRYWYKRAARP